MTTLKIFLNKFMYILMSYIKYYHIAGNFHKHKILKKIVMVKFQKLNILEIS